ncbi:MAG: calcineurin-like phosphoesterase C-terminal domain-containing protein, partial [Bacteroidales bacterium]|nr:calcineurin-like phosphoesterase C-terminal domain-containing protein [Bacteroidales bacterium]
PRVKETLGLTRRPCYYVIGNHDRDRGKFNDPTIEDNISFAKTFGPSYYSFNRGDVHFLVLNNILTINPTDSMRSDYIPGIHPMQAEFIKNDLKNVPADKLIIVCAHIPFFNENKKVNQTKQLISLLQNHPKVFIAAGHAHNQIQLYLDEKVGWKNEIPVHQLVAGTICGGWWRGEPDIFGIPGSMMRDGTPQGYWFMHIDGTSYQMEYKVSGMRRQKQMHIWVPQFNEVDTVMNPPDDQRDIWVNVYAGNEFTDVKLRIDSGEWQSIERKEAFDPYILRLLRRQEIGRAPSPGSVPLKVGPRASTHLWHSEIPEKLAKGAHVIEVKARNEYGLDASEFRMFWK